MPSIEDNKGIITRYYKELWNTWDLDVADVLIAPDIAFRGSLGVMVQGLRDFKRYVRMVRAAFPDFHNTVEEMVAEGDTVAVRLSYQGTHWGELFGVPPTGRQATYAGVAIFRLAAGKIVSGWVLGDTLSLLQQLGVAPAISLP